ncbi:hypothetical protein PYCC9005_002720 [Savitreella phatthalungensis]
MKLYETSFNYEHPWSTVTLAYFLRYPNPYAKHVLASDVISRTVDDRGRLHSTRLLLKRGKLPSWGARLFNVSESYIIEESVVDPHTQEMITRTRNLDHTKVLQVIETQHLRPSPGSPTDTIVETTAQMISPISLLGSRIEGVGISTFRRNFEKSRLGMQTILEALSQREGPYSTGLKFGNQLSLAMGWRRVRDWQTQTESSFLQS